MRDDASAIHDKFEDIIADPLVVPLDDYKQLAVDMATLVFRNKDTCEL